MRLEVVLTVVVFLMVSAIALAFLLRARRPRRSQLNWGDVSTSLPERWEIVTTPPTNVTLRQIDAPFSQAFVRAAVSVAPSLPAALETGRLFRLVGPPEALKALDMGTLNFLKDKQGDLLGTFVQRQGAPFEHNARWHSATASVQGAAVAAAVFQFLSLATAQYYLHQINSTLQGIDTKLRDLVGHIEDSRIGKLNAARDVLTEINKGCLRRFDANEGLESFKAMPEFWSRMANAEAQIREVLYETEAELDRKVVEWRGQLGKQEPDGTWSRESKGKSTETKVLNSIREWLDRRMPVQAAAIGLMAHWYQIALTFDAFNDAGAAVPRYAAMVGFLNERRSAARRLETEHRFWLEAEGGTWRDLGVGWGFATATAVGFAAGLVTGPLAPIIGGAVGGAIGGLGAARDAEHKESKDRILNAGDDVRRFAASFEGTLAAPAHQSSEFFLARSAPDRPLTLCVADTGSDGKAS